MGKSLGFNSSKSSDGWDWEWFRYGSTVILNRTDNNWMQLTPREFTTRKKKNDPLLKDILSQKYIKII